VNFAAAVVALLLGWPASVAAHPLSPALLELEQGADATQFTLRWKTPRADGALTPVLPPSCSELAPAQVRVAAGGVLHESTVRCNASLAGATFAVAGLDAAGNDALVRIHFADGRTLRALLRPDAPSFVVPARESAAAVFAAHVRLGAGHLASGLDHLLFLAGLVALLRGRRLVAAITAFTIGHSVTLALASFGVVRVPALGVEVAIAATLVWLALELARRAEGGDAAGVARRPLALPFAFGLLHGLGFASALGTLGIPAAEIPLALAGFNIGIEVGQLALVLGLLVPVAALRRRADAAPAGGMRWAAFAPAYAIGSLGVCWCLERLASAF
jgi:hypothetical protein